MYTLNQTVNYTNGSETVYTGNIVKVVSDNQLVVIDPTDTAGMELFNAGYAIGDCISPSQIIN